MSDHQLLSWSCPRCQRRSWLHLDHCMACGEARPKPVEAEPQHDGKPETLSTLCGGCARDLAGTDDVVSVLVLVNRVTKERRGFPLCAACDAQWNLPAFDG